MEGRLPIVPKLSVALVDFPERLNFDLRLYGGDLTLLPGLEAFLAAVLRDFVISPYVLPGRFEVELTAGGEEAALGFDKPKGMLFVTVEEATRVPRVDLFSAADCYVKVGTTGGAKKKKKKKKKKEGDQSGEKEKELLGHWSRTRTIPNDNSPCWRQELRPLLVRDPRAELVDFVLMDADELGGDDEIGRCSVRVSAVVAALEEREREEKERERQRRRRRRRGWGLARPPSPVSRPEVVEESAPAPVPAAPAAASAAAAVTVGAVSSREREEIEGGREEEKGEAGEEDGGFVVVGRATDAAAASSSSPPPPPVVAPPPPPPAAAAAAAAAAPPVSDRSGGGGRAEFFVGVPVDDEETRAAFFSAGGAEANDGGEEEEDEEEEDEAGAAATAASGASSSSSAQAPRGSGSIDDPLEFWLPCPRLSASSSSRLEPAIFLAQDWRRPSGGGLSGRARKAGRLGSSAARGGCLGCVSALVLPLLPGGKERLHRGGRPADPELEGPPLLRVRIAYHAFSEEEIELAGGGGGRGRGGGGGEEERRRRREGEDAGREAGAPPPPIPISAGVSLPSSSRAADILGGGILFVRPRQARNLRPAPLWRRCCGRGRAAWVVRVAVAGGPSEEGGPVSRGGTSPTFTEVRERERERERALRRGRGGERKREKRRESFWACRQERKTLVLSSSSLSGLSGAAF